MARLYAGTSGFSYPSWKPDFYPQKLPAKQFLTHYAGRLNAVESNYTFRSLPSEATVQNWIDSTPSGFVFACKGHMKITHMQRLKESESLDEFLAALEPLREAKKLGPVLFQLPPNFKADEERLGGFLERLPKGIRFAFEFRHESWLNESVFKLLKEAKVALCMAESDTFEVPPVVTADFVYVRLRKSDYQPKDLKEIAGRVNQFIDDARDVYLFFKHEESPGGALLAETLLKKNL